MIFAAVCFTDSAPFSVDAGPGSSYVASLYLHIKEEQRGVGGGRGA